MANSPSIVLASLSDDQLKKSIDSLVTHVDEAMKKMVQSTNNAVGEMEAKLKSLGNLKIDSGGSSDAGASKLAKAQEEYTESVKKTTAETKRMGKETEMTFDQIAAALSQARRVVSDFNTQRASGMLPSSEDYKKYEQALARIVEYNDKLKQSALGMATANQKAFAFDGKRLVKDFFSVDERLKQLNKYYAEQEKLSQKAAQSVQQQESAVKSTVVLERDLVEEERQRLALIREIAKEARESMARNGASAYLTPYRSESGAAYIYAENDARAKGLTIEQQIANILRENDALYQASARSASMIVEEEKKITQEQERRKKYVAPSATDDYQQVLRNAIANKLGIDTSKVINADAQYDSIKRVNNALKQLQDAYARMSNAERNSPIGRQIIRQMQELERQTQQLRAQMSRPINLKDVMGLPEKTLDDIAYKMRQLASYRSGLDINTQHNEIRRVNYEYDVLKKKMDEVMAKNQQMIASNTALGRSWNYMKNRLAFYFTVGASTQFVKNLIEVRSQYEMNEKALGILIDSAERGTQIFNELSQMALVSPYTLIELSNAAKQLTAYDIAAKDVVDTTRRLADISAAVGVPVERFTYALGQVKAFGHLTSQDARQFLNTGVPLVKELAKHYTELEGRLVSTADVYDRMKKHAVSYNDVVLVLNQMTDEGGRFFDYQAKMADTLKVQLANLTLAWNNMLNDIGNSQQGLLTSGIGALKELLLHWKDLDRILTNLAVTIGTAKAAQLLLNLSFGKGTLTAIRNISAIEGSTAAAYENALSKSNLSKAEARWLIATNRSNVALREAMVNMKLLTVEEAKAAANTTILGVKMGLLGRVMKTSFFGLASVVRAAAVGMGMLGKAMWSLATNPVFLAMTAMMAAVDALLYYNQVAEKTAEMNKAIADNAKEASKALGDYLKDSVNIANRTKAEQSSLSIEEGEKAWQSLREQIELSSDAHEIFISELLKQPDINKRLSEGFTIAEKIKEATAALSDFNEEELKVSQDSWLKGAFGEGVGEDLEDYIEMIKDFRKEASMRGLGGNAIMMWAKDTQNQDEAKAEMQKLADDVAQVLSDRLGEGVSDPKKIREALERIKKEIKEANPQIRGEVANFFDVEIESLLQPRFKALGKENVALQQQFLHILKRDYSSAFSQITDSMLEENARWGKDQEAAIRAAAEKFKTITVPEFHSAIDDMVRYMNSQDWRVRILTVMGTEVRSDFQKDWDKRFGSSFFKALRPSEGIELPEYVKETQTRIKSLKESIATFSRDNSDYAKQQIKAAKEELALRESVLKAYNQPLEKETGGRSGGGRTSGRHEEISELQKALKDELQLIDKVRSQYKKLTDAGVNSREAIVMVTNQFKNSIAQINKVLGKNGIPLFDIKTFAGTDNPYRLLQMLEKQLKSAKGAKNVKPSEIKDLELKISELHVDVKTYDTKKIAEGLNSSLAKIKDEYELAVELDANPELGSIFADAFGIDTSALPRSIADMIERMQDEVNRAIRNAESLSPRFLLEDFDILSGDLKAWAKRAGIAINSELYKEMENAQKAAREAFKKNVIDTEKILDDYVSKYGDYADKIAEIEAERLTKMKQLNDRYALGSMSPLQYSQAAGAIEQSAIKERDKIAWDEFKDSEYYVAMFEKLEYVSTSTLKSIRDRLTEVKNSWKDLSPEQLKWVTQQYEKLDAELLKREPFANLTTNVRNYIEALKSGNEAETRFATAQDFYDKAKATESVWKQLLEYKKRNEDLSSLSDKDVAMIARQAGAQKELVEIILQGVIARGLSKEAIEEETLAIAEQVRKAKEALDAALGNKEKNDYAKKIFKEQGEAIIGVVGANLTSLGELRDFIRDDLGIEVSEELDGIINGLTEAGQGVEEIVSGLSSGNFVGALVGVGKTLYGVYDSIANIWGAGSARNKKIDRKIKDSERSVKRLENAYINLEYAINSAYGAAAVEAKMAAISNKQLQLAELNRQLALEKSRDSKKRDDDRIMELQGQIIDLQNDIKRSAQEVATELLGISSVGDAVLSFMDAYIGALRKGEDAQAAFTGSWKEMIANMIKQIWVTKVIGPQLEALVDEMNERIKERSNTEANAYEKAVEEQTRRSTLSDDEIRKELAKNHQDVIDERYKEMVEAQRRVDRSKGSIWSSYYESLLKKAQSKYWAAVLGIDTVTQEEIDAYRSEGEKSVKDAKNALNKATIPTIEDMDLVAKTGNDLIPILQSSDEQIKSLLERYGLFEDESNKNLSALQQGIQGITEDTAGALEALMNGVSQQVYYHSSLLEQIRDSVVGLDLDVSLGVQSQMLLQLQSSYQTQQAIQQILEGVLNPSGRAFSVELIS